MKREFAFAITGFMVLFVVSFYFSIVLGMGRAESLHEPSSIWMYSRRGLMVILGLIIPWLRKKDSLATFGWRINLKWLLLTVGLGILMGNFNPGGFDPRLPVSVLLALFHSFCTELFFRRYLFMTFNKAFTKLWPSVILSSLLYGIFYLTVWKTWEKPVLGNFVFIVLLFSSLGMLFSYSYEKSGSFYVPWLMHFFSVLNYRLFF